MKNFFPEHKEIAIEQFIEERMQSYFLKNPNVIHPAIESANHAGELLQVSPSSALVMYTTAIELYLRVTEAELGQAKNIAYVMLTEVVEPVLNNLELVIAGNEAGFFVSKA